MTEKKQCGWMIERMVRCDRDGTHPQACTTIKNLNLVKSMRYLCDTHFNDLDLIHKAAGK